MVYSATFFRRGVSESLLVFYLFLMTIEVFCMVIYVTSYSIVDPDEMELDPIYIYFRVMLYITLNTPNFCL
jgi:hypothetical protein